MLSCVCLGVHVRCCSRACASRLEDCACLSPCVGDGYALLLISTLSQSYPRFARLVLRSLRSRLSLSCVVEGVRGCLLSSLSGVLAFFAYLLSLASLCWYTCSLPLSSHSVLTLRVLSVVRVAGIYLSFRVVSFIIHSLFAFILHALVRSSLSY